MQAADGVFDFDSALKIVLEHAASLTPQQSETIPLLACRGRVLAAAVFADRDQPPFDRSTRDGFALRAGDAASPLKVVGLVRAGEQWEGSGLETNAAIEIMTGAPVPAGADAVVMIEHVERDGDTVRLIEGREIRREQNIVPQGSEARAGQTVLPSRTTIEGAEIALAASCGCTNLEVFRRPKVAVIATGDELVDLADTPGPQQIRNSNSYGLAALIAHAGGEPVQLAIAQDRRPELEATIRAARSCDLMLLSGGVSMGKYDLVEEVLQSLGAEFFITGVWMQPGKPLVFGRLPASGEFPAQYFFGLPGNPISTQVTFHCFVEPMLRASSGTGAQPPRFLQATLAEDVSGKAGLMRVLPARWTPDRVRPEVRVVGWQGSGDLAANARANCYAVLPPDRERFTAGDVITILLR
ncbi:gephyrin-like molybdotransferase Glp [Granulicella sp. S190]|uniref:molybdopterin molybdotransferase MoeA n=1 Tax=Granulicella sp. S190 TaxID=1747226 RepID=UPI00131C1937|nr:gephyrin-like molybdotransferase Glp [Granulicella sp. S190]